MRHTLLMTATVALMGLTAAPALAQGCNAGCQLQRLENNPQLRTAANFLDLVDEINKEDQRLVEGTYDPTTGELTLYTQDMVPGADGDISRRAVVVTGMQAQDGADGTNGADGADGTNGADGVFPQADFDRMMDRYGSGLSAAVALGGLELRTPGEGDWSISGGIGGIIQGGDSHEALALGVQYGLSDRATVYLKVGQSLDGRSTTWFAGAEMLLGGGS